jgi:hypothetical protein
MFGTSISEDAVEHLTFNALRNQARLSDLDWFADHPNSNPIVISEVCKLDNIDDE